MGPFGMGFPRDVANDGWRLYILSLVMIVLAGLFVVARLFIRVSKAQTGWDDLAVVASLFMSIMVSVCMQLAIENGYGMHKADLRTDELRYALKLFFIAQTPYKISICLNKLSAILFCLRIFVSPQFRIAAFTVMGIIVAWSVGGVGATIWQCVPVAGAWDKSLNAKCIDSAQFWVAYAVMNVLTDVMVLALPIPPILRLQLQPRDKILLCGIFTLGGFVTVTSILRTTSVQNSLKNKEDITFNFIQRGIWTLLEMNFGIISACLPALRKPIGSAMTRLLGARFGTSTGYTSGPQRGGNGRSDLGLVDMNHSKPPKTIATVDVVETGRHSDEIRIVGASSEASRSEPDMQLEDKL